MKRYLDMTAILPFLSSATEPALMVCSECGNADVLVSVWTAVNSGGIEEGEGSFEWEGSDDDRYSCPGCDMSDVRVLPVRFCPEDAEQHGRVLDPDWIREGGAMTIVPWNRETEDA